MKNLQVTNNANQAFKSFALSYSNDADVKFAVECASDYLDTVEDVDCFEKMLALFLLGKYQTTAERLNENGTWRTEAVKYAA